MLSKNEIKLIKNLKHKKQRYLNKMFVVEGKKSVFEFINSKFVLHKLFSKNTSEFKMINVNQVSHSELEKISYLTNPDDHLAIFKIPNIKSINKNKLIVFYPTAPLKFQAAENKFVSVFHCAGVPGLEIP